ncbi:hypothetical protein EBB07_18175 [Paenibacillaceae bacterium]|nr:hypothetical protein EBB07_18175 [Paenibacillaceae bacterium]
MKHHTIQKTGTMIAMLLVWLMSAVPTVYALDFALEPLPELAENSETIVLGTVQSRRDLELGHIYNITVNQVLKGSDVAAGDKTTVRVTRFADEGHLSKHEPYLLFLVKSGNDKAVYQVSGVHQGFIQLKEDGFFESRFYKSDEIADFIHAQGWSLQPYSALQGSGSSAFKDAAPFGYMLLAVVLVGGWFIYRRRRR